MVSDFKKKTKNFGLLNSVLLKIGIILILVVFILLMIANISNYRKKTLLMVRIAGLEEKIRGIKKENEAISQNIQKINDDSYVEKVAREELDLQKPGEKVYSFIRTADRQTVDGEKTESSDGWFSWVAGSWAWLTSRF